MSAGSLLQPYRPVIADSTWRLPQHDLRWWHALDHARDMNSASWVSEDPAYSPPGSHETSTPPDLGSAGLVVDVGARPSHQETVGLRPRLPNCDPGDVA